MKVTAKQIAEWADSREAQASLPRLVRRLALNAAMTTRISFPAGDSVSLPGWDGELCSNAGDPWVPKGKSFWELSCEARPTVKANRDYKKRTKDTDSDVRLESTLVVVTARRWPKKTEWLRKRRDSAEWLDFRAYDADDLEC